jgi:hypothetical protein
VCGKERGNKTTSRGKEKGKKKILCRKKKFGKRTLKVFQSHSFVPERYSSRVHLGTEFGF